VEEVPWRAEVHLTPDLAGKVLRRQFPALNVRNVTFLNEGWDSFAFLADDEWVFLFPKRREREQRLVSTMRMLDALHGHLSLPVPRPRHWGSPGDLFPFHFVGYGFLPGAQGDTMTMPQGRREGNARRLGEFISALHRFSVDRAAALGIGRQTRDHVEVLLDEVRRLADRVTPRLPARWRDRCAPFLDGSIERPPRHSGQCCLTHGDLQAEHVLLNTGGEVAGVIDFADACISEPAGDYVGLCAWQGWDFARAALAAAGSVGDQTTEARIVFMARCLGLIGLGWADWQDRDRVSVYQGFLHNAFGG